MMMSDAIRHFLKRRRTNELVCILSVLAILGEFAMCAIVSDEYEADIDQNTFVTDDSGFTGRLAITFFYKDGCPYCESERQSLEAIVDEHPGTMSVECVHVADADGNVDTTNNGRLKDTAERYGLEAKVPFTVIGDHVLQGYGGDTEMLEQVILDEYDKL